MGSWAAGGTHKWSDQIFLGVRKLTGSQWYRKTTDWLKIGTGGGAVFGSRATSAAARRIWKKATPGSLERTGLMWCFLLCKCRVFNVTGASQWLLSWPLWRSAALHTPARRSVISGLLCFLSALEQITWPHSFSGPLWPQDCGILIRNSGQHTTSSGFTAVCRD